MTIIEHFSIRIEHQEKYKDIFSEIFFIELYY